MPLSLKGPVHAVTPRGKKKPLGLPNPVLSVATMVGDLCNTSTTGQQLVLGCSIRQVSKLLATCVPFTEVHLVKG